jgi:hypothetical protein
MATSSPGPAFASAKARLQGLSAAQGSTVLPFTSL